MARTKLNPNQFASGIETAEIATSESRTSTSYGDLTTVGPSVTVIVPASGKVILILTAYSYNDTASKTAFMGFSSTGANTIATTDSDALRNKASAGGQEMNMSFVKTITGLTPGSTVFTAKYKVNDAGTGVWANRKLTVIPVGG